jgi:hypothetical protein
LRCNYIIGPAIDRSIRPHPFATGLTVARSTCALSERVSESESERERERERGINYQTSASQTLQKPPAIRYSFLERVTKLLVVSIYEVSYGSGRPHRRHGHRIDKGNVGKPGRVQPNTRPSRYGPSQSIDGWLVSKSRPRQPQLHAVLLSISTAWRVRKRSQRMGERTITAVVSGGWVETGGVRSP